MKPILGILLVIVLAAFAGKKIASIVNANDRIIQGDYSSLVTQRPVLYIAEQCPACKEAINFISKNNLDFEVRSSASYPAWIEDMTQLGINEIPLLVYSDRAVLGFTPEQYTAR
ncbi:MAG: hypothetical protein KJ930_04405 [Gammaproteobacteria bacterium]|jgi:hypothetical protein|nr:hypothetical protein [Gammaproteobacteria bacterium]MBU2178657.1 hypothetical protein [Gammaproteobacteria bacterium]MBU2223735.1 hypothetical protein [Gammaproteobacteria bacterium]MBU2279473.1 hypothetical protein [Gammaproteobacteria bacterium]MBU2428186.1 hypothetical protein [Gammaproteobacteria bacterium]